MLTKNKKLLKFTTNGKSAYTDADIIIIAVGTPEHKDGSANLNYVYSALDDIISARNQAMVILKSTVPIGTNDKLEKYAETKGASVEFISNPEFLSQGTAVRDTLFPARIVVGTKSENARKLMEELYSSFTALKVFTDRCSAEMIKYAANDFLALKISYINEIANLCEKIGANAEDVALGIGYDPRIGNLFLRPGVGYGGSCFPKDTKALHWLAGFNNCELKTIKAAIDVNESQKLILLKKARNIFENFNGLTVAILGLTFKPDTDDLREAPSIVNIRYLTEERANINVYDPVANDKVKNIFHNINVCDTPEKAIKDADVCFVFTEWKQIKELRPNDFEVMKQKIVFDGRNCFDYFEMKNAGILYHIIGRI
jgi:UDPglucose 6-dehydrogenase